MVVSKSIVVLVVAAVLTIAPAALRAQEADERPLSLLERSGGWESYLRQDGDYNSAVYEVGLPGSNALTPYSLVIGRPYSNCDRPAITYYVAPAAEETVDQSNLKGSLKVGERSFDLIYRVVSGGNGVFTIHLASFSPEMITAMLEAASAEISLPNVGDFTAAVPLAGFAQAWERAGRLCGNGEGIRLF